ncbi:CopD family protein [Rhodopseudomonas sp. HC1]|uniref:copper resistance CopC/CopD family protein n=1 Tax=Rhodopseudomonas infernalis TaxID=2897386 RepID=UPI001EE7EDD4|nr:CopD family protein [Rhodopseudomonas infernalis]MCG6206911.1 CopD family protein [Rhodopseudomonas infernalis]
MARSRPIDWRSWLAALAIVLLLPALAHAHAALVASDPAAEAVLPTAPATLSLTFNEPVEPLALALIDAQGGSHAITDITRDGASLRFAPPAKLGAGGHVLSWRVISADGHPIGGSLTFWVGAPGSALPAIIVPDDPARRTAIWVTRVALQFALLIATGGAFFLAWMTASAATTGMVVTCAAASMIGLAALALSVGLQGLDVLDVPFARLASLAVWRAGMSGSFGAAALLAAVALALTLLSLRKRARLLSLGAVTAFGAALAVSGHAATAEPRALAASAVLIHGASLALWIGALLPLAASLRGEAAQRTLRRFSRAIPPAIAALLISGIVLSALQLGRVEALWGSDYGRVLLAKLVLVTVLLLIALWNRARLTPRLYAGAPEATSALRRTIAAELVLVVGILGLVGVWRFTPPPHDLSASKVVTNSAFVHIHGERAMAGVTLTPDRAGPVEFSIVLQTADEAPLAAQGLTVTLANPVAGIEPASAEARRQPDGAWQVRMSAPLPGNWTLTLGILISDFEKVSIEGPVVIR